MIIDLNITPYDILFFIIPAIMAVFFYARSAKSVRERDKIILFVLSIISASIWFIYIWKFLNKLVNSLFYGFKY